jgi:NAD-specific glutamate dehydrogenase
MEIETLATGGAGAGIVGTIIWLIGRWAARNRWTTTTVTEPVELIAKEREELRIKVHELELRTAAAEAVAKHCRSHMDRKLGVTDENDANH